MARRRRRFYTPLQVRNESYDAAIEPGLEKYRSKKEMMVDHFSGRVESEAGSGPVSFTEYVDRLIAGVLDSVGVVGQVRVAYYVFGRKLARFVANYANVPEDVIRNMANQMLEGYIVKEPGIVREVAERIIDELIRERANLRRIYGLG